MENPNLQLGNYVQQESGLGDSADRSDSLNPSSNTALSSPDTPLNAAVAKAAGDIFAVDSPEAFRAYMQSLHVPHCYGFIRRAVDEINKRIGKHPLDIGSIASALNQTKRTFQRRLALHGYTFSELRDVVRRCHGVQAIALGQQTMDEISKDLDFADRSGLAIAFKRWTGLSPRLFRKIAREYMES